MAGLGAAIFAGMLGVLIYFELTSGQSPPRLVADIIEVSPTAGGFSVRFSVRNEGDLAAAELEVGGELRDGQEVLETSTVTLDYVPPGSSREATFVFERDPASHELTVQPRGFREP